MANSTDRFIVVIAVVAAVGFLATAMMVSGYQPWPQVGRSQTNEVDSDYVEPTSSINLTVFTNLKLEARAAIVYDPVRGEVLYDYHKNAQLPIASITKMMTAIVAAEQLDSDTVVVSKSGLWHLGDLIQYTLVSSSNEGAQALAMVGKNQTSDSQREAEKGFVDRMNEKAKDLGLTQTYFINVTGLDINEASGGSYSSAEDVANLLAYGLKKHAGLFAATRQSAINKTTLDTASHLAINTNEIINEIPGLLAGKTGFTDVASGNLAIAFDRGLNQPLIIVVLGSSWEGRFSDTRQLVAASLTAF